MEAENKEDELMYDGHCAFAVSTGSTHVKGGKYTLKKDGKTYVFSNYIARLLFKLIPGSASRAHKAWEKKK